MTPEEIAAKAAADKAAQEAADKAAADKKNAEGDDKIDPLTTDIKGAIEKARKQEKQKLYGEIEASKKAADDLASRLAKAEADLKAAQEQLAAKKGEGDESNKKGSPGMTAEQLDALADKAVSKVRESFQARLANLEAENKALQQTLQAQKVAAHRDLLIAKHKDDIVEDLLTGDTVEALDTSLITAKQALARVKERLKAGGEGLPAGTTVPEVPSTHIVTSPSGEALDVTKMTMTEYAKHRATLLRQAGSATAASRR